LESLPKKFSNESIGGIVVHIKTLEGWA
jgi:hypothetical protein